MTDCSFLNAFMPTLPWWFLAVVISGLAGWAVTARVRLWNAQRCRVERPVRALQQAKDALARVIADDAVFGEARSQALSAYESVGDALKKEKED